jgi:hypothetical protein
MVYFPAFVTVLFASVAFSAPVARQNPTVTPDQILKTDPRTADCNVQTFPGECVTAAQFAGPLSDSFQQFDITTVGEKAALLSLILFETGGLKANRNHFPTPGNPGQGTRNLMNFPFIFKYTLDIPALAPLAEATLPGLTRDSTFDQLTAVDPAMKNAILNLVLDEPNSAASAAWFLKQSGVCDQSIVDGLKAGTEAGWETYITKCVGTTVTPDRLALYNAAKSALA